MKPAVDVEYPYELYLNGDIFGAYKTMKEALEDANCCGSAGDSLKLAVIVKIGVVDQRANWDD